MSDTTTLSDLKEYAKHHEECLESLWIRDIILLFEDRFSDFEFIGKLWASMANVCWHHSRKVELELSWAFREAGAICAVLHGLSDSDYPIYLEFNIIHGAGNVNQEIGDKMKELGWSTAASEGGLYLIIPPNFGKEV